MDPTYPGNTVPLLPLAVVGVGFILAVVIGSIAWFNSKRPAGWEDAERPSYVPKVKSDASDAETSTPSSET